MHYQHISPILLVVRRFYQDHHPMQLPIEFLALWAGLIAVIVLDCIWVTLLKKYVISNDLKLLMLEKVNWTAAILTRILLIIWCYVFVVLPTSGYELGAVGLMGWFLGLIVYGVYECTNKALLFARDWKLVARDILRWIFLCGSVSMVMSSILY